jgi:hypothetical protein
MSDMLFLRQSSNRRLMRFLHSSGNLVTWLPTKIRCSRAVRQPTYFGSSVIVLKEAGHLADDIRHMHKLIVRDVKEFQTLEAGKVPGQLLYPIVLEPQVRELRYAVETSVVQVHDAITRQVESV